MKFYFVPYHIVKDKIQEIIESNKRDFLKHYGGVNVDYTYFEQLSYAGLAYVAIAVDEGDIAGFAGFIMNDNATHQEREAENVVFYLLKEHRNKSFKQLLEFSKQELCQRGAQKVNATIKSDVLARALRSNGYRKSYEVWSIDCV